MFTDQDIENWLDGTYEGDSHAIEKYLATTDEGVARLSFIKSFYQALKEQPMPELSFSLREAVVNQLANRSIKQKEKTGFQFAPILIIMVIGIIITGFLFIKEFTFFTAINNLMAGIIGLLVVLFIGMNVIDWNEQRKRYVAHDVSP